MRVYVVNESVQVKRSEGRRAGFSCCLDGAVLCCAVKERGVQTLASAGELMGVLLE